jgi:hypothetical protein
MLSLKHYSCLAKAWAKVSSCFRILDGSNDVLQLCNVTILFLRHLTPSIYKRLNNAAFASSNLNFQTWTLIREVCS